MEDHTSIIKEGESEAHFSAYTERNKSSNLDARGLKKIMSELAETKKTNYLWIVMLIFLSILMLICFLHIFFTIFEVTAYILKK